LFAGSDPFSRSIHDGRIDIIFAVISSSECRDPVNVILFEAGEEVDHLVRVLRPQKGQPLDETHMVVRVCQVGGASNRGASPRGYLAAAEARSSIKTR
jgi:hypothetical protein